ncbi:MAG: hypothetical protein M1822_009953 [Bathelium mastoideum]|nr:MAG: hypothetical protein M1822_009953 [Bathelium mastoideum]
MANKTVNGVAVEAILKPYEYNPEDVQRIPGRSVKPAGEVAIVESDPQWPEYFQTFKSRILAAFESTAPEEAATAAAVDGSSNEVTILAINHVGSTAVPALPAKAVIDIDLVLSRTDLAAEPFYVPRLAAAGFEFRIREPLWHEHRYFWARAPLWCNLHVWGPGCPEVERHRIFRDRLRAYADDMELYARIKKESAAASPEKLREYNLRKEWVIKEILIRAFKELGYLD